MKKVAAILLAAGRSSRMGKFKPLLPFGDKSVIESCLNNFRNAGVEEVVVVAGHRNDEIRNHLHNSAVGFTTNPDPDSPMSASIAYGVARVSLGARALLIGLVDHPAVDSATIKTIIQEWQAGSTLVQPEHSGRGGHPVLIDARYRDELLNLDPELGLRSFFEVHRHDVRRLAVESPYVARDMDTWEDYVRLHRDVFRRPPKIDSF